MLKMVKKCKGCKYYPTDCGLVDTKEEGKCIVRR